MNDIANRHPDPHSAPPARGGRAGTLTATALENADLLRLLAAGGFATKTELAERLGRDRSNVNKTLKVLEAEGLVLALSAQLTDAGANAVRMLDALGGVGSGGPEGPTTAAQPQFPVSSGFTQLLLVQIAPDPLNPRKHFDEAAIAELADSIARDDLLENLVVRPDPAPDNSWQFMLGPDGAELPLYRLVAGERRWRAIKLLIERGAWAKDRPIPCKVVQIDDAAHRRLALVENLQRKDLRPIDEATALRDLMAVTGQGTAEVAAEIGFTQRFVQQRLQLLALPERLQDRLNAGELTVEEGRAAAALWPKLPPIKQVELREGKITVEAAKAWAAQQPEPVEFPPEELLILLEVAWEIAKTSNGWWTYAACRHQLPTLPRAMETAGWLVFDHKNWGGPDVGTVNVKLTEKAYKQVVALTGSPGTLARAAIEPALRKARVLAIGGSPLAADHDPKAFAEVDKLFKAKRHVTEWLNGPFEPDPAWIRQRDEAAARRAAEHEEYRARNAEQHARDKAEREARQQARAVARARALELMTALPPAADAGAEAARLIGVEHPLPWRWVIEKDSWGEQEGLQDANGDWISLDGDEGATAMMVLAIVNGFTGHPVEIVTVSEDAAAVPPPEGEGDPEGVEGASEPQPEPAE